ncbi:MAG TPA: glycosyltransferase [candidate division Zixibacteria bacterium]|nr:glycosyltransferase [candidate division Zixibacteria bacterium]
MKEYEIYTLDDYEKFIGAEAVDRIWEKSSSLQDFHVANINATYYGGGVAGLLSSFILLMNSVGIKTGWRVIQGSPDFFSVTKKMHNALQGGDINLTDQKKYVYESVIYENAVRNHLDHDLVIIHDPQPLPMIMHYTKRGPWIWRCHIDLTSPNRELWEYIRTFVEKYDTVILTLKEYQQELNTPQLFFQPAIDPFNVTNKEMSEEEMQERLDHYDIPTDLPLIAQISRFDRWKDPEGVIAAFKKVRKEVDCTLVLLGNIATDDPEGKDVYESLLECQEERIIIMSRQDTALVNALQTKAAVIVQKSKREGFGLTVTEAMWKGTPVVGGDAGGIRKQIQDGENGYLVSSVDETAERILKLLKDKKLRDKMGQKARESVKKKYLLSRYLENYLDLFNSYETSYTLKSHRIGNEFTD